MDGDLRVMHRRPPSSGRTRRRDKKRRHDSWQAAADELRHNGRIAEADAIEHQLAQIEREGERGRDPIDRG